MMLPLVDCRDCASPLLQPELVVGPIDGESIVTRFCPECGRRDVVVARSDAVEVWLRRERRISRLMHEYAAALRAMRVADESPR